MVCVLWCGVMMIYAREGRFVSFELICVGLFGLRFKFVLVCVRIIVCRCVLFCLVCCVCCVCCCCVCVVVNARLS